MIYYGTASSDTLSHIGTKEHSGRRPWGSGERPYQRLEGTSSYRRKMNQSMADNVKNRKIEKKEAKALKRAEKRGKEAKQERKKEIAPEEVTEILNKRSSEASQVKDRGKLIEDPAKHLKYVYANKKYYSTEEIRSAISRYEAEQSLKTAISKSTPPSKAKRILKKADDMQSKLNKTADTAIGWVKAYNKFATVYNGFSDNPSMRVINLNQNRR